jgi:hypothetical protein
MNVLKIRKIGVKAVERFFGGKEHSINIVFFFFEYLSHTLFKSFILLKSPFLAHNNAHKIKINQYTFLINH